MRWMPPSAELVADGAPPATPVSGAEIDGGWYLDTVRFAEHTPWLHEPAAMYTTYGIFALVLLLLAAWWRARHSANATMAAALMAPVAMVLAYVVNDVIKVLVTEPRPCQTLHVMTTVLPCDGPTDWSFPSNHSAVAAAIAAGLFFANRGLAWVATAGLVLMALSRVYVGAHYPHDVVVGLLVGAVVGVLLGLLAKQLLGPLVGSLRRGPLRPLLLAPSAE